MEPLNALSTFGGIECGRMALSEMGIVPEKYLSSEIDEYSIKNSKHNFPDVVHIGSVTRIHIVEWVLFFDWKLANWNDYRRNVDAPIIDLLIGGSPCQDVSVAGAQKWLAATYEEYLVRKSEWTATRSDLFWEYHRVLYESQAEKFMFENVRMKKEFSDIIDRAFGFSGDLIDAALLSPQHRKRVYWCGKRNADGTYSKVSIPQPEDAGMKLADILEYIPFDAVKPNGKPHWKPVPEKYLPMIREREKAYAITATYGKIGIENHFKSDRTAVIEKAYPITASTWGTTLGDVLEKSRKNAIILQIPRGFNEWGFHGEKVPTVSANGWYNNNKLVLGLAHRNRGEWKAPECNFEEKANAITTVRTDSQVLALPEYLWRPLTVRECARCQWIPDSYEFVTSDSNRTRESGTGGKWGRWSTFWSIFCREVSAYVVPQGAL